MSRRIEQILELFQEQLEVEGYDADDIDRARVISQWDAEEVTMANLPEYLTGFLALVKESAVWRDPV